VSGASRESYFRSACEGDQSPSGERTTTSVIRVGSEDLLDHALVVTAMTSHPHHKLRVLVFQLDDDGRQRISASYGFTQFSAAVAFQAEVLARPSIVRADLLLVVNSSSKPAAVPPPIVPETAP
jgi:hypothetical protein